MMLATAFNGILAGSSLDQSIKQLPARQHIGVVMYSAYSQASDLGNGILWYATLGIGAAVLTLATAVALFFQQAPLEHALPLYAAAGLSVLHSLVTTQAAPLLFSQRQVPGDPVALGRIFDRFAHWQTQRALLQTLTFVVLVWALLRYPQ